MSDTTSATASVEIHPKFIQMLSPPSHFFFTLWPLIIANSSFLMREKTLRNVNREFRRYADSVEDKKSIEAKRRYMHDRRKPGRPALALEGLPFDSVVEWRNWGADKAGFESVDGFRDFCALGDIDPDVILKHDPYAALHAARSTRRYVDDDPFYTYMWSSRAKDILVLSSNNPLEHDGYCHYFGIVGRADKLTEMYYFFRSVALYDERCWARLWI